MRSTTFISVHVWALFWCVFWQFLLFFWQSFSISNYAWAMYVVHIYSILLTQWPMPLTEHGKCKTMHSCKEPNHLELTTFFICNNFLRTEIHDGLEVKIRWENYVSIQIMKFLYFNTSNRCTNCKYFQQLTCEFVNVTRWRVAICGEYMKSKLKVCWSI